MKQMDLVQEFIEQNIFHSEVWDELSDQQKGKAVNNASLILKTHLPKLFSEEIPLIDLVEQVLWILKKDDTIQRAEMGITYLSVEGMSVSFAQKERPIAPSIVVRYNLEPNGRRRRAVPYTVSRQDTMRSGINHLTFNHSGRWY